MEFWVKLFRYLIYAGHIDEKSADVRKQILISALFSLLSSILLFFFGIDGVRNGRFLLGILTLAIAMVMIVNFLYLRRSGNHRFSSLVIMYVMMFFTMYLICSGGSNNTGGLWFFIMPSLTFYILGLRLGKMVVAGLFAFCIVVLYLPDNPLLFTEYPHGFAHRFVGSLFAVSVIAWAYEYTREDGRRELLNLSRKLDEISRRDELTGLANRRDMLDCIQQEINRYERSHKPFSVILADLDYFKNVNDTYGHECGDKMLVAVAETLNEKVQKRDVVARWGGEELLILLPETTAGQAYDVAERLRVAVESTKLAFKGEMLSVTLSLGVAEYSLNLQISELLSQADVCLYRAKATGRNRVCRIIPQNLKEKK